MADQIAFLSATHPPELRVPDKKVLAQPPTSEPGSGRVRRLIAAVQLSIAVCAILYAIAYRFVVKFVDFIANVSDLALVALLLSMLATLFSGVLGWLITANQVPQYHHPSSARLFHLVLSCTAAYLNITTFITQAVAIWFSNRLVPYFPVQAVELPHHAFLLVLTSFCTIVNLISIYRFANDLLKTFKLEEKGRTGALSVVN